MKKMSILCLCLMLSACVPFIGDKKKAVTKTAPVVTACADARPKACTRDFRPVCGVGETGKKIQTFGNACSACSDDSVLGYTPGECR